MFKKLIMLLIISTFVIEAADISYALRPVATRKDAQPLASSIQTESTSDTIQNQLNDALHAIGSLASSLAPKNKIITLSDLHSMKKYIEESHNLFVSLMNASNLVGYEWEKLLCSLNDSPGSALSILAFLNEYTLLGKIHNGSTWDMTSKGPKGDGAWGPLNPQEMYSIKDAPVMDRGCSKELVPNHVGHIFEMVQAVEDIICENYSKFENSIYGNKTGNTKKEVTRPDGLNINFLNKKLRNLGGNSFTGDELTALRLAAVFHDYGRLVEAKGFSMNVRTGDIKLSRVSGARIQHRESGMYFADHLLTRLGVDRINVEIIRFLIRHHSDYWDMYCLDRYQKYNNDTTIKNFEEALAELTEYVFSKQSARSNTVADSFKYFIRKALAVIAIADVYASGDRYLSDRFLNSVLLIVGTRPKAVFTNNAVNTIDSIAKARFEIQAGA
jgi:hypothetical protein